MVAALLKKLKKQKKNQIIIAFRINFFYIRNDYERMSNYR